MKFEKEKLMKVIEGVKSISTSLQLMMNGFESMKKTHAAAVDIIQCAKVKNDCHWIF